MILIISGTPGTGKTTLAKKLAKKLNYKYICLTKLIKDYKLEEGYDLKRKCLIIDIKKLNSVLIDIIKKQKNPNIIFDSHLAHYLPKKYVDLCIITKCELKELQKRLKKRKYSKEKIRENLDAEIFDICLNKAKEIGHKIITIDTTNGLNPDKLDKIIKEIKKAEK